MHLKQRQIKDYSYFRNLLIDTIKTTLIDTREDIDSRTPAILKMIMEACLWRFNDDEEATEFTNMQDAEAIVEEEFPGLYDMYLSLKDKA